ncbi:hypothetical protein AB0M43_15705 [Longispora sp. NPDC051575]|uniref:hypothetical protein n=1 Tax=Longispora sp. NPDC051575 TaxID=3154943 RepID=UPI003438BD56
MTGELAAVSAGTNLFKLGVELRAPHRHAAGVNFDAPTVHVHELPCGGRPLRHATFEGVRIHNDNPSGAILRPELDLEFQPGSGVDEKVTLTLGNRLPAGESRFMEWHGAPMVFDFPDGAPPPLRVWMRWTDRDNRHWIREFGREPLLVNGFFRQLAFASAGAVGLVPR